MFLGVGNGLVNEREIYHSSLVVSYGEDRLFIDCGSNFPDALHDAGMSHRDIKHMYISHIHADHAGSLEWLGFISHFDPEAKKVALHCHTGVYHDLNTMLTPSMQASVKNMRRLGLKSCFRVRLADGYFTIGRMICQPIKTIHVSAHGKLYSYGLYIFAGGRTLLFTSDTQYNPRVFGEYYKSANLILHDCSTGPIAYPAHPHIGQLQTLPDDIRKKMLLYHYGPGEKPDAVELGFKGYAEQRKILTV